MKIGNIEIANNLFLAPMAGVTDRAFREICKGQGAGCVYTEMVSAKGMYYNSSKTALISDVFEIERPATVQIFGSDPEIMAKIAYELNGSNADFIDINMGCPTPKITKSGEGSALMKTPRLAGKIIKAVCDASVKPVTVKMRKGWDDEQVNAPEIASIAEQNGAQAVVVHGRTRVEFYKGKADWDIIRQVKDNVKIPVIGSGDIKEPEDAKSMMDITGCDGVMIGRASEGNPWIFARVNEYLANSKLLPEKTFSEKLPLIFQHIELCIKYKGEYMAVRELRRHLSHYIKGLRNCTVARAKIFRAETGSELREILYELDKSEDQ